MTNYCRIITRECYLNTEFGLNLACKRLNKTPEAIEALVGRYARGKRKGELRGRLTWRKVETGGWFKTGRYDWEGMQGNGFVVPPGITFAYQICDYYGEPIYPTHELQTLEELTYEMHQLREYGKGKKLDFYANPANERHQQ